MISRPGTDALVIHSRFLEEFYEHIAQAAIGVELPARQIVHWNTAAEAMFGRPKNLAMGQTVDLIYPDASSARLFFEDFSRAMEQHEVWRTAWQFLRYDGSNHQQLFSTAVTAMRLTGVETGKGYALLLFEERNRSQERQGDPQQKRTQDKLSPREPLPAAGLAASKLAHDISNRLNGMYTAAQLLEQLFRGRKTEVDDLVVSTLGDLKKEVDRARAWLQEFRALSVPMKFDFELCALAEIARDVAAQEGQEYAQRGVALELSFDAALPRLTLDREKIKRAILNLCRNAVDAMPRGGKLIMRGYRSPDAVILEVTDTGVGVPERLNILDLFTSTKPGAGGLGLPLVQQIVSGHQGKLSYVSQMDKGTTFRVSLPLDH